MTSSSDNESSVAESGFDLREHLATIWSYKAIALAVTSVVSLAVLLFTVSQPPSYEAVCTIEYDPRPVSPLGSAVEDIGNPTANYWMSREFFATQTKILSSRAVAERVVEQLGLHRDADFLGRPQPARDAGNGNALLPGLLGGQAKARPQSPPPEEAPAGSDPSVAEAAGMLQARLRVSPVDETRLVTVRVSDRNPERAATLANAVAEAYIEKTIEDRLASTVRALEWLGTQLDSLRADLERSELALHDFAEEHNVLSVSMEDPQNLVSHNIQEFNAELTRARTRRIALTAHLERLRTLVHGRSPEQAAANLERLRPQSSPRTLSSESSAAGHGAPQRTIGETRTRLRAKLAERQGLSARYGPNHPQMQQLGLEVTSLRTQLEEEVSAALRTAEADVIEARSIEAGLRAALDEANRAGMQLTLRGIEYERLSRQRENNSKLYNLVLERTTETDLTRMLRTTHARVLDRALQPSSPVSPKLYANVVGGLGMGLVLGIAVALLMGRLDRRLKTVADVESLGLTVLGVLPKLRRGVAQPPRPRGLRGWAGTKPKPAESEDESVVSDIHRELFVHTEPMSAAAESFRTVRTNLTFMGADQTIHTLAVTSPSPREGKTTLACNLAIALAQSGKRVLVVDTDLRRPRVHKVFGIKGRPGVTSVLVGDVSLEEAVQSTVVPHLDALTCGPIPPNPSELLHGQHFGNLIATVKERYDRVVFDSPPIAAVTDAAVLAPQVDATMLVVEANSTSRDAIKVALRQLRDVKAHVVGGVLNNMKHRFRRYGAGGYYNYRPYYRSHDEETKDE